MTESQDSSTSRGQALAAVLDRTRAMALSRKLGKEIEQALKKVSDGIITFTELGGKMAAAEDVKEKDKWMMEMKRELKKLQRLRETIRGWAADQTIRDVTLLNEARRAIEFQMEMFKECEKEAKLKPFAKAALETAHERVDPAVLAKEAAQRWLRRAVQALGEQVEHFEADLEALDAADGTESAGKGKAKRSEDALDLERLIGNHGSHSARLEQVLRLLENDQVTPEELEANLKDSLEHYLECATEPEFLEDELMYEGLPMLEVNSNVGKITRHERQKKVTEEQQPGDDASQGSGGTAAATTFDGAADIKLETKAASLGNAGKKPKTGEAAGQQRGAKKKRGGRAGAACMVTVQKNMTAGGRAQPLTGLGTLQVIRPPKAGQPAALQPDMPDTPGRAQRPHLPPAPPTSMTAPSLEAAPSAPAPSQPASYSTTAAAHNAVAAMPHGCSLGTKLDAQQAHAAEPAQALATPRQQAPGVAPVQASSLSSIHSYSSAPQSVVQQIPGQVPQPFQAHKSPTTPARQVQTSHVGSSATAASSGSIGNKPYKNFPASPELPAALSGSLGGVMPEHPSVLATSEQAGSHMDQGEQKVQAMPEKVPQKALEAHAWSAQHLTEADGNPGTIHLGSSEQRRAGSAALPGTLGVHTAQQLLASAAHAGGQRWGPAAPKQVQQPPQGTWLQQPPFSVFATPLLRLPASPGAPDLAAGLAQVSLFAASHPDHPAPHAFHTSAGASAASWFAAAESHRANLAAAARQRQAQQQLQQQGMGHPVLAFPGAQQQQGLAPCTDWPLEQTQQQMGSPMRYHLAGTGFQSPEQTACGAQYHTLDQSQVRQPSDSFDILSPAGSQVASPGSVHSLPTSAWAAAAVHPAAENGRWMLGHSPWSESALHRPGVLEAWSMLAGRQLDYGDCTPSSPEDASRSGFQDKAGAQGTAEQQQQQQQQQEGAASSEEHEIAEELTRASSPGSLQTIDEEPDPAARGGEPDLALPGKTDAGHTRRRGGRGRTHGAKAHAHISPAALVEGAGSGGATSSSPMRLNKPSGPMKLADVILPALEARAKEQQQHQHQQQAAASAGKEPEQSSAVDHNGQLSADQQQPTPQPPPPELKEQQQEVATPKLATCGGRTFAEIVGREQPGKEQAPLLTTGPPQQLPAVAKTGKAAEGISKSAPRDVAGGGLGNVRDPIIALEKHGKRLSAITAPVKIPQPQMSPCSIGTGASRGVTSRCGNQLGEGGAPGQAVSSEVPWAIKADWEPFQSGSWAQLRASMQQPDQAAADIAHASAVQVLKTDAEQLLQDNTLGELAPKESAIKAAAAVDPRLVSAEVKRHLEAGRHFLASAGEPEYVPMGAAEACMQQGLAYSMRQLSAPLTPLPPHLASKCCGLFWPSKPCQALPQFDEPGFFDAMALRSAATGANPDLLFFAFYFQPGTLQQRYAAEALQKLQWQYHPALRQWLHVPSMRAPERPHGFLPPPQLPAQPTYST